MPPPESTRAVTSGTTINSTSGAPHQSASTPIHPEIRHPTSEIPNFKRQWKHSMKFDPTAYGPVVAAILALDGNGERLMPLASGRCSSPDALAKLQAVSPAGLF